MANRKAGTTATRSRKKPDRRSHPAEVEVAAAGAPQINEAWRRRVTQTGTRIDVGTCARRQVDRGLWQTILEARLEHDPGPTFGGPMPPKTYTSVPFRIMSRTYERWFLFEDPSANGKSQLFRYVITGRWFLTAPGPLIDYGI